jgi:hypothetical protein
MSTCHNCPRRRRRASAALALALLGLWSASCGSRTPPTSTGEPGVILRDDFSQPDSGWDVHAGPDMTTDYDAGRYLIAVGEPNIDVWGRPGLELADALLEADAQYSEGPLNNEFGLMCRYAHSSDADSFYYFFISSDGYYEMGKVVKGTRTPLEPAGGFQPSPAIKPNPQDVNHLAATCRGDRFSFAINGTPVGEFTDDELPRGDVGLVAGTYDEGGVRIHFDNVVVRLPG